MKFPLDYKILFQGVLVLLGGYIIWGAVAALLANLNDLDFPMWSWIVLTIMGFLIPILTGVWCAHRARIYPIIHGIGAGLLGALIVVLLLLSILIWIPIDIPVSAFLGWLMIASLMAWVGAMLTQYFKS